MQATHLREVKKQEDIARRLKAERRAQYRENKKRREAWQALPLKERIKQLKAQGVKF